MGLFSIYLLYGIYVVNPRLDKKYLEDYTITNGKIVSFYRKGVYKTKKTEVLYRIKGKEYLKEIWYDAPCKTLDTRDEKSRHEIFSMNIPVAVSSLNPEYALPLIRPEDFKVIGKPFPDSLIRMYEKYFNCTLWEELNSED